MQRYLMMSVVLFFMHVGALHAAEYQNVEVKKLLTATKTTTSGEKIRYLKSKNPEVTALTVRIPPGGSTGWHKHPVPVYAYVLEGRLTVALKDGRTFTFNKGDALVEVVNTFHNGTNSGPEPVTLAVFYTGAAGLPNVIKEEPAAAPSAP
ncbi:cupin domain-containing protein [Chlorobium ferrooxidans]|uniref:Cupin region n=1 Tax=Chlorobium ferrooxidans DSM 13031 TaxID=377431 RepID=Q0YQI1_9CHLB|nr:cupin domain-containing protein [Chlorobium ferrooxidans]EAT58530.1 Cupin region [Chlorobium ferrooxidans DSM 13031]